MLEVKKDNPILLSVVIPTHRRPADLQRLLTKLSDQVFTLGVFEILVVSNLQDKRLQKICEGFQSHIQNLRYFEVGVVGVNRARNLGLKRAHGRIIQFFDDDCFPDRSDFLESVVTSHDLYTSYAAIGGVYEPPRKISRAAQAYNQIGKIWMGVDPVNPTERTSQISHSGIESWNLVGGNVSYKKSAIVEFAFNEKFIFGSAETELHLRMKYRGLLAVLLPSLGVLHDCKLSFFGLVKKAIHQGVGSRLAAEGAFADASSSNRSSVKSLGQNFYQRLFSTFFLIGYELAGRKSSIAGRLNFRSILKALCFFPIAYSRPDTLAYVGRKDFFSHLLLPHLAEINGVLDSLKRPYWLCHKFYWWGHGIFCRLVASCSRGLLSFFWKGYRFFQFNYVAVTGLINAAKSVFWRAHQFFWDLYNIFCQIVAAIPRLMKALYWRLCRFAWAGYGLFCLVRGAIPRLSKEFYWKQVSFLWVAYDLLCRFRGGIPKWSKNVYWKLYQAFWNAYDLMCRIRGAIPQCANSIVWRAHQFVWDFYSLVCRTKGATVRYSVIGYWNCHRLVWLMIGFVPSSFKNVFLLGNHSSMSPQRFDRLSFATLQQNAAGTYWKLHQGCWNFYDLICRVRSAIPRKTKTIYWKIYQGYWNTYNLVCRIRGLIPKKSKSLYWRTYELAYGIRGAVPREARSAYWKFYQGLWNTYDLLCRVRGAFPRQLKTIYWRTYELVFAFRGAVPRQTKATYWKLYQAFWNTYGLICRVRGAVPRQLKTIYWRSYELVFAFRGAIPRQTKAAYWRLYQAFWNVYGLICRIRGAIPRESRAAYWKLYQGLWNLFSLYCRIRGAIPRKAKVVYWKTHQAAWDLYGGVWKLRALYWKTYTFFVWKIGWGFYHRVTRNARTPSKALNLYPELWLGERPWSFGFSLKFFLHSLRASLKSGSKTASFLHKMWSTQVFPSQVTKVFISCSCETDDTRESIVKKIMIANSFGYKHFVFDEEILGGRFEKGFANSLFVEILEHGNDITLYYSPSRFDDQQRMNLVALKGIGINIVSAYGAYDLRMAKNLPAEFAIKPDVAPEDLLVHLRESADLHKVYYLDLLNGEEMCSRQLYRMACGLLSQKELRRHHFVFEHVVQSTDRFFEGVSSSVREADVHLPEWSIIIPCFENTTYLTAVVEHISRQKYKENSIEVLIIDDGSSFSVCNFLKSSLQIEHNATCSVRVVRIERKDELTGKHDKTFRAGVARNAGILASKGKKILFLDSDIIMPKHYLRSLDQALERAEVVQSVRHMLKKEASVDGVRVENINKKTDTYKEDPYWESFKAIPDWNNLSAPWKYVCTYAFALRRETLNAVRFFRPEFSEYGFEDTEMGYRLYRAGYKFHLLKEPVYHLYPKNESWTVHFDEQARFETLRRTARLFYRMHGDPSIFYELRAFLDTP